MNLMTLKENPGTETIVQAKIWTLRSRKKVPKIQKRPWKLTRPNPTKSLRRKRLWQPPLKKHKNHLTKLIRKYFVQFQIIRSLLDLLALYNVYFYSNNK